MSGVGGDDSPSTPRPLARPCRRTYRCAARAATLPASVGRTRSRGPNSVAHAAHRSPRRPQRPPTAPPPSPLHYTPGYLAEKILTSKAALEGERKQVTVLFANLKGSMELLVDRDPEEARQLLNPVLERMMEAVHRYEGTVNQVMGDGIMTL